LRHRISLDYQAQGAISVRMVTHCDMKTIETRATSFGS
jgi:hypothetical protein